MYSNLPNFVLGFHGCDYKVAESIILHQDSTRLSQNDYDWLGPGIYFWENNPQRAVMLVHHCQRINTVVEPRVENCYDDSLIVRLFVQYMNTTRKQDKSRTILLEVFSSKGTICIPAQVSRRKIIFRFV